MSKARSWKLKGKTVESGSDSENDDVEEMEEDVEEAKKPRINKRSKTEEESSEVPVSSRSSRKMMVTHKGVGQCGWDNMEQVSLKHPRTGNKSIFLMDISKTDKADISKEPFMFEVMTLDQDTRSWFLDESVVSDGNLYTCTPMDPLFILLPFLMKTPQAKPLEDHISEGSLNKKIADILCHRLLSSNQLENIAIKKVCDDIIAYKYSEENTLSWLSEKVENTLKFLSEKDITSTEASISANFTKSSNGNMDGDSKKRDEYLRYSCEIVGEYLEEELKKKLFVKFGLPFVQEKTSASKRKNENDSEEGQNKKAKVTDGENIVEPLEDYGSSKNPSTNTPATNPKGKAKEKELLKAAKGTHSLLKFFAPKAK